MARRRRDRCRARGRISHLPSVVDHDRYPRRDVVATTAPMKLVVASLAASLLLACGSEPGPNVTLFVKAPADSELCIGVAGFEVIVSSASGAETKVRKRVPSTILAGKDCLLPTQLSFPELDA